MDTIRDEAEEDVGETFKTDRLDLAAFAMANGHRVVDWEYQLQKAIFRIEGREVDIRAAFMRKDQNVNANSFINSRNQLIDIIKHR